MNLSDETKEKVLIYKIDLEEELELFNQKLEERILLLEELNQSRPVVEYKKTENTFEKYLIKIINILENQSNQPIQEKKPKQFEKRSSSQNPNANSSIANTLASGAGSVFTKVSEILLDGAEPILKTIDAVKQVGSVFTKLSDKPAPAPAPAGSVEKLKAVKQDTEIKETRTERKKNDRERDASKDRHSGLMKWLVAFETRQMIMNSLKSIGSLIGSMSKGLLGGFKSLLTFAGGWLAANIGKLGKALLGGISLLGTRILGGLKSVGLVIKTAVLNAIQYVTDKVKGLFEPNRSSKPDKPDSKQDKKPDLKPDKKPDIPNSPTDKGNPKPNSPKPNSPKSSPNKLSKVSKAGAIIAKQGLKTAGLKAAVAGAGAASALPTAGAGAVAAGVVSAGLWAWDIYSVSSEIMNIMKSDSERELLPVMNNPVFEFKGSSDISPSNEISIHQKQAEQAEIQRNNQNLKNIFNSASSGDVNTSVVNSSNVNNSFVNSFSSFQPDINYKTAMGAR